MGRRSREGDRKVRRGQRGTEKELDWIRKQDPTFCGIQETHLNVKDKNYLRVKAGRQFYKPMVSGNEPE